MEISRKIYLLRTESGLTQSEFAKIAGVTDKAVSAWEQGKRDPKIKYIKPVCNHFGIDVNSFIDETSDIYKSSLPSNITPLAPMKKVPLVGQIACGTPILAEQNITDYIDLPGHIRADFALTCKGESMIGAGIQDGDIVYVRQQEEVENGQIAAVMVGSDEATLKRVYVENNIIQLVAENPSIPPKVFFGEDTNQIRIVGLAVAYTHTLE